jgi:N-acetylglucosaminyl-diphospho-decaprenol L-rhamnosyltransferase
MDLSILIISYNTRELTLACLRSVYEQTHGMTFEVIVVDNDSADGSPDAIETEFPQVRVLRQSENLGFARGNNLAAQEASGDWLLLLNPDTEIYENAISRLVHFAAAHPEGGIYGGRTVFPDGSLNIASCWNRPTPWSVFCVATGLTTAFRGTNLFDPEAIGSWKRDSVRHVDIVVGCFLLISKPLWDRLGGFADAFFMFGEEADLCLRARGLGYRPMITPDATIMHLVGASAKKRADKLVLLLQAKVELFRRHWPTHWQRWGILMLLLWSGSRALAYQVAAMLWPWRFSTGRIHWTGAWRGRHIWRKGYSSPAPAGSSVSPTTSAPTGSAGREFTEPTLQSHQVS